MPRMPKKRKLELSFFLNERGRVCTSFMLRAMLARSLTVLHEKAPPCPFSERVGLLETV